MARAYVDDLPEGWAAVRVIVTGLKRLGYAVERRTNASGKQWLVVR